jgi:hypothetical protein
MVVTNALPATRVRAFHNLARQTVERIGHHPQCGIGIELRVPAEIGDLSSVVSHN